jgi:LPXTG-site transpeptidase (sortase) family protein
MQKANRGAIAQIAERPVAFAAAFFAFFIITLVFLAVAGATPDAPASVPNTEPQTTNVAVSATSGQPEAPVRIVANDINLDVVVQDPTTTDVTTLDADLLQGAVHYPTSADLGVNGTVLIFGHSSYLPVLNDQQYRTFDGIQNLKEGDIVSVYSGTTEYRYSVTSVKVADATQDVIELPSDGMHLTLVTCDSFASKTNRFIVTADFVGAYALSSN